MINVGVIGEGDPRTGHPVSRAPILEARDITVRLRQTDGGLVVPVREASLTLAPGEIAGIVGESGSGKTTLARALTKLFPRGTRAEVRGEVHFGGRDLLALPDEDLRTLRGNDIAYVFQSAEAALNPTRKIEEQLRAVIQAHRKLTRAECAAEAVRLLELVHLPDPERTLRRYPHQISGGMKQRVMIAIAIANDPAVMIADEPTSSLDVLVRERIIELFDRLRRELGLAILMISHDLHLVAKVADKVLVVYGGRIVESGPTHDVLSHPKHHYTSALLSAAPTIDANYNASNARLVSIPGKPIGARDEPVGCAFAPRCVINDPFCREHIPSLVTAPSEDGGDGHAAACWFPPSPPGAGAS
jgi:oligopeptide/dipeptide ABC transporter ATP-binding protein